MFKFCRALLLLFFLVSTTASVFKANAIQEGSLDAGLAGEDEKVDIVDLAIDSMSGLTSQPALGSIVSIMKKNFKDESLGNSNCNKIRDTNCCAILTNIEKYKADY